MQAVTRSSEFLLVSGETVEALYTAQLAALLRALRRHGIEESELPDIAHEVFIVALRRRDELMHVDNPRAWLFGVARLTAANRRRKVANRRRREHAWGEARSTFARPPASSRPEATLALDAFLSSLSPKLRDAFVLGELQGLNRNELAEALGVPAGTAYGRLRSARQALTEYFADDAAALDAMREEDEHSDRRVQALLPLVPLPCPGEGAAVATTATATAAAGTAKSAASLTLAIKSFLAGAALAAAAVGTWWAVSDTKAAAPIEAAPVLSSSAAGAPVAATRAESPKVQATPKAIAPTQTRDLDTRATAPELEPEATVAAPRVREAAPPRKAKLQGRAALKREVELLTRARSALTRNNLADARAALATLRDEVPAPKLLEQLAALETQTTCHSGSSAQRAAALDAFERRYPSSSYLAQLRLRCDMAGDQSAPASTPPK